MMNREQMMNLTPVQQIAMLGDKISEMREETDSLRRWREGAQVRRGINPPINPERGERLDGRAPQLPVR